MEPLPTPKPLITNSKTWIWGLGGRQGVWLQYFPDKGSSIFFHGVGGMGAAFCISARVAGLQEQHQDKSSIRLKYGPPKAVDGEFIYKIFARTPRDPKIDFFMSLRGF